ncbi:GNAT family N-acetyltransferase [Spirosoma sp. KNUC1025]|uniref:GNAT family N-acetyltransferase n=1 Tax=Spirosoma sp. KNUC1025 TaxID=2894082 RepID=UPI0038703F49|nr:N-acetyltransferase family protein [Spirosoma sp. KNUC1025]
MIVRFATSADAPGILTIYAPYITQSIVTFEYEVPTEAEFAERIQIIQQQFPYLVAEEDGRVLGYAYASRHRDRIAYQWSAETSVYIHPDSHRLGIARQLYTTLFQLLRWQGYYNAYAGITMPNPKSEAFHRSMGFEPVGVYTNIGYKLGAWHSVAWYQLTVQPYSTNPVPPVSITTYKGDLSMT